MPHISIEVPGRLRGWPDEQDAFSVPIAHLVEAKANVTRSARDENVLVEGRRIRGVDVVDLAVLDGEVVRVAEINSVDESVNPARADGEAGGHRDAGGVDSAEVA